MGSEKRYIAYTDGSCDNRKEKNPKLSGGWAALVFEWQETPPEVNDAVFRLCGATDGTTNNRMEMIAILEVAKAVPEGSKVYIKTDSRYAIGALKSGNDANYDLGMEWQRIVKFKKLDVEFRWVRGHKGNIYNEACDKMAKTAFQKQRDNG